MSEDSTVVHFRQPEMVDRRLADRRGRCVRHGHGPDRTVQTGIGAVEVRRAKVRDPAPAESEHRIRCNP